MDGATPSWSDTPNPYLVTGGDPEAPQITAIVHDDAVTASGRIDLGGVAMTASGSAKRHPKDRPDRTTGLAFAYARMLRQLADECEATARRWSAPPPAIFEVFAGGPPSVDEIFGGVHGRFQAYLVAGVDE